MPEKRSAHTLIPLLLCGFWLFSASSAVGAEEIWWNVGLEPPRLEVAEGPPVGPLPLTTATDVDVATGALVYRFAFQLPLSRRDLLPAVELTYNSSLGSSAWIADGWSLSIPHISRDLRRGPPTYDRTRDTFLSDEGVPLVQRSEQPGGEWLEFSPKTERRFRRYRYSVDQNRWEVLDPSGKVLRFGSNRESREGESQDGRTYRWYLEEVRDPHGNNVRFKYTDSHGSVFPESIRYTGNDQFDHRPGNKIRFKYGQPEYSRPTYRAGFYRDPRALLLERIEVWTGDKLPSWYDLEYERIHGHRLLSRIQQTASVLLSGGERWEWETRSWRFSYYRGPTGLGEAQGVATTMSSTESGTFVKHECRHPQFTKPVRQCTYPPPWTLERDGPPFCMSLAKNKNQETYLLRSGVCPHFSVRDRAVLDLNGDGASDLVYSDLWRAEGQPCRWRLRLHDKPGEGNGFKPETRFKLSSKTGDKEEEKRLRDFFGANCALEVWWIENLWDRTYFNGGQWRAVVDLNGDGRSDLLSCLGKGKALINRYPDFEVVDWSVPYHYLHEVNTHSFGGPVDDTVVDLLDFNGDGRPDFLRAMEEDGQRLLKVWLNDGVSGFLGRPLVVELPPLISHPIPTRNAVIRRVHFDSSEHSFGTWLQLQDLVDINGDGLPDVIQITVADDPLKVFVWYNEGNRFSDRPQELLGWLPPGGGQDLDGFYPYVRSLDLNADGLPDNLDYGTVNWNVGRRASDSRRPTIRRALVWPIRLPVDRVRFKINQSYSSNYLLSSTARLGAIRDVNGDGYPDRILGEIRHMDFDNIDNVNPYWMDVFVEETTAEPPYLLKEVTDWRGLETRIEYTPSTHFPHSIEPRLASNMWVVTSVSSSDVVQTATHRYQYRDGVYDPETQEFHGFGSVTVTLPDGGVTEQFYHQGEHTQRLLKSETVGAAADDASGMRVRVDYSYEKQEQDSSGPGRIVFPALVREKRCRLPANDDFDPVEVCETVGYEYGPYGKVRRETHRDQQTKLGYEIRRQFAIRDDSEILLVRPSREQRRNDWEYDGGDDILELTEFLYDGSQDASLLEKGDLTEVRRYQSPRIFVRDRTEYDDWGLPAKVVDGRGEVWSIEYDDETHTLPVAAINPLDMSQRYRWNRYCGKLSAVLGPNWAQDEESRSWEGTELLYDGFCRLVKQSETVLNEQVSRYQPVVVRRLQYKQVSGAAKVSVVVRIDDLVDYDRRVMRRTRVSEDRWGRPSELFQECVSDRCQATYFYRIYDAMGRLAKDIGPCAKEHCDEPGRELEYDELGRKARETYRDGSFAEWSYRPGVETYRAPTGKKTERYLGALRLRAVREEADSRASPTTESIQVLVTQDFTGRVRKIRRGDVQMLYDRDWLGRVTEVHLGKQGGKRRTWRRVYDDNDNLVEAYDPDGNVVTYRYDALDRLIRLWATPARPYLAVGDRRFEYDASDVANGLGRLARVTGDNYSYAYTYDSRGRIEKEEVSLLDRSWTFRYRYHPTDRISYLRYPNGDIFEFLPDERGNLSEVRAPNRTVSLLRHGLAGRLREMTFGRLEVEAVFEYDEMERLTRQTVRDSPGGILLSVLEYHYDSGGNLSRSHNHPATDVGFVRSCGYAYDGLNRLDRALCGLIPYSAQTTVEDFEYSPSGRIRTRQVGDETWTYRYEDDSLPGAVTRIENQDGALVRRVTYDHSGRAIKIWSSLGGSNFQVQDLAYNALGQLISIDDGIYRGLSVISSSTQLYRDHSGRPFLELRDGRRGTFLVNSLYHEDFATGAGTEYLMNGWFRRTGESESLVVRDRQGSPVATITSEHEISDRFRYAAFGKPLQPAVARRPAELFQRTLYSTGSKLYHFPARDHDPVMARMLSPDPVTLFLPEENLKDLRGFSLYDYAGNNPTRFSEVLGLASRPVEAQDVEEEAEERQDLEQAQTLFGLELSLDRELIREVNRILREESPPALREQPRSLFENLELSLDRELIRDAARSLGSQFGLELSWKNLEFAQTLRLVESTHTTKADVLNEEHPLISLYKKQVQPGFRAILDPLILKENDFQVIPELSPAGGSVKYKF